jgi:undecaprenyl diphosphate synthase
MPEENKEQKVNHLAIILDGNRRYAKERGMPSYKGHEYGAEKLEELIRWSKEFGLKELTFYILSTENLKRDPTELKFLFDLFRKFFKKFADSKDIHENKVKIKFIGDLSLIPEDIRELALELEDKTKNYNNYKLNFCFAYGGRLELVHAFNKLKDKKGKITEEDITNELWLKDEPDLIIRTGNAVRTSNFLPWQSAYSEWIFLEKMWPAFAKEDLISALEEFKNRKRNFGK